MVIIEVSRVTAFEKNETDQGKMVNHLPGLKQVCDSESQNCHLYISFRFHMYKYKYEIYMYIYTHWK